MLNNANTTQTEKVQQRKQNKARIYVALVRISQAKQSKPQQRREKATTAKEFGGRKFRN